MQIRRACLGFSKKFLVTRYHCCICGITRILAIAINRCKSLSAHARRTCFQPEPLNSCEEHPCIGHCDCIESKQHEKGRFCVSKKGYIGDDCKFAILQGSHYVVTIPLPFTKCGTSIEASNEDVITFRNRIWINREISGSLIDMPVPILDFRCRYQASYRVITSIQPQLVLLSLHL
ncbi:unnamed protein product [Clavelina lepadiformis]|uniref:ZP domain-containing protein n=1 Tax=Clavelina lepadiformis TaxID=159417 RepID=A0ABP0GS22_CLALP